MRRSHRSNLSVAPTGRDQDLATAQADPFVGLNANPVMAASRRLRVSGRGLYAPTPAGQVPHRRIMGVDNEQQAQSDYVQNKGRNDFMNRNTAARAADPLRPQAPMSTRTPKGPVSVQGGGQDADPVAQPKAVVPPTRYMGNPNAGRVDATDEPDEPAPKVKPQPGRPVATPPGNDVPRTSAKGSAFSGLPRNNDQYLADRISKDPARQGLDATGLPRKKKTPITT